MNIKNHFITFSKFEWCLWLSSLIIITLSFLCGNINNYLTLIASLVGATALIFVSKGNVIGQILTVVFSLLYSIISFDLRYYGEMITYLGMTSVIALLSIATWLKNPYDSKKAEVRIAKLSINKIIWLIVLTILITYIFYFILAAFNTANLIISTISIATSFSASYLMLFRSSAYALAYAANDIVLITLWTLASIQDASYLPMVICFSIFFINDLYGFYNWRKLMIKQTH